MQAPTVLLPTRPGRGTAQVELLPSPIHLIIKKQSALMVNIPKTLQYSLTGIHITRGGGFESWQNLIYAAIYSETRDPDRDSLVT